MGEGYPKKVGEWSERHDLVSMGHPPGNYEPTAVDMYGDRLNSIAMSRSLDGCYSRLSVRAPGI